MRAMNRLLAGLLLVVVIVVAILFMGPMIALYAREGPGDVIDNDHDDYPHDCLMGDACTPFPMP